jgi:hypothetical protein
MRAFDIDQQVWIVKTGLSAIGSHTVKEIGIGFWPDYIREVITSDTKQGSSVRYLLNNGENKREEELFASKEDAIDHIIGLLEEEKKNV